MKNTILSLLFILVVITIDGQTKPEAKKSPVEYNINPKDTSRFDRKMNMDYKAAKDASVMINGKSVPYTVTASTTPVWDDKGKTIAGIFSVYYERTDITDKTTRPIVFSFNGGPGSASLWMMIGYTGPRLVKIDSEGYPIQPFGLKDNPNSILDVADLVYVDPVNTGFSRPISDKYAKDKFFGVNADIEYLAEWVNSFVTNHKRWASPKFLIGESYGTVRVAGLALELQQSQWMYPNGVVLVSPTTLGIDRSGPINDALRLPYFAATAWYHKALAPQFQNLDLNNFLPEVERFTLDELLPAVAMGSSLDTDRKNKIVSRFAAYSGLSEQVVRDYNLQVPFNFYWKELLRSRGQTIGRLDSRYVGIDNQDAGNSPEYNAEFVAWLQSFTPSINMYLRDELGFQTSLKYNVFGSVYPWNNNNNNTGSNLRSAMAQNPYLHLMVQSGYYDGACDYFNAKYNLWQLDFNGRVKDRMSWKGYRGGHMMYLRQEDLKLATQDLRDFIKQSIDATSVPARYK